MKAFERVTGTFTGAVAATALLTAPTYAQDRPTMDEAPPCGVVEVEGYEHGAACATPGYETPRTLDEIQADEDLSQSVVLHFGPGHLDADLVAADLRVNEGVPIVAIPGGPDHGVQVVIMGFTTDRLIFDQDAQNSGRVGSIALVGYQRRLEALRTAAATTTSAGLELRTEAICGELQQTSTGRILNARTSAHAYSQDNIGNVGISIFAGNDLGEYTPEFLGTSLVNSLRRRGIEAECFVHNEAVPNGTGVRFHIAGLAHPSGQSLSITESLNAELMDSLAAEARTAGMLLSPPDTEALQDNRPIPN